MRRAFRSHLLTRPIDPLRALVVHHTNVYRVYSKERTRTAPRKVLCFCAQTYRRVLQRCVSLISSNPCNTTAESSGRDARAEAGYLMNMISSRFLRTRDAL